MTLNDSGHQAEKWPKNAFFDPQFFEFLQKCIAGCITLTRFFIPTQAFIHARLQDCIAVYRKKIQAKSTTIQKFILFFF